MMWGFFGFVIGAVLGSFVKALADRSLNDRSFRGRSYCPHCKHILQWYDLLPIFSFILLTGRCRYCHKKIGIEYLLVELVMGLLIGFLFLQENNAFELIFKTFFIAVLVTLFLTDLKKMLIPDRITIPAILIGIIAKPLIGSVIMGLVLAGFFLGLIIITKGKGMGGGDVKLAAFLGIGLGFPQAAVALVLAFLIGAVFAVGALITKKKHFGQVIPFGPFLVIGALISLFWGNQIVDFYLKLGT